jgi:hypothetical protein
MSDKDTVITQDVKVLQQLMAHAAKVGAQVNVNMIGQINVHGDLMEFMESLPEPRLSNLITLAKTTAIARSENKTQAAKFLGIDRRTLQPSALGKRQLPGPPSKLEVIK